MSKDDEKTKILYLPLAEGERKLHDLRRELDGALRAQRRSIRWLTFGLVASAMAMLCFGFFVLGVVLR